MRNIEGKRDGQTQQTMAEDRVNKICREKDRQRARQMQRDG